MATLDQTMVLNLPRYNVTRVDRAYIANWMSMVVINMCLAHPVLFLGMAVFDSYLTRTTSYSNDVAQVTVACLALAAKVESVDAPSLADYMDYMTEDCCVEELRRAEIKVLTILDYNICFIPTTYSVMYSMLAGLEQFPVYVSMVLYLAELSTMEYTLQRMSPRQAATTCCCYALIVLPQPFPVFDQLSAAGLSSIDATVAAGMVTLSGVHDICCQAAVNDNPYASTTKYPSVADVGAVLVAYDG